jgi:hypothetical protein
METVFSYSEISAAGDDRVETRLAASPALVAQRGHDSLTRWRENFWSVGEKRNQNDDWNGHAEQQK